MENIQVTNAEVLAKSEKYIETPDKTFNNTVNGKYSPYGITGYIVDECSIVCSDCIKESERNPKNAIHTNTESDYPGFICEGCNKTLDTYILVYRDNDPKLYYRLIQSENLGSYDKVLTIEQIAKECEQRAYEEGYSYGPNHMPKEVDSIQEVRLPTDSANWANNILPSLRALAGYEDPTGKGTYTKVPNDDAYHIFNEGIMEKFREGYYDKAKELLDNR